MTTAESAVIALVEAQDAVRRFSKEFSGAMRQSFETQMKDRGEYTDWLEAAYKHDYEGESEYSSGDFRYVNHDDDVEGYLAEHCPHALRAHLLIQERKEAKKQLGIARRRVTMLGRNLLRARDQEPS